MPHLFCFGRVNSAEMALGRDSLTNLDKLGVDFSLE
jgi:hypothetical protein